MRSGKDTSKSCNDMFGDNRSGGSRSGDDTVGLARICLVIYMS